MSKSNLPSYVAITDRQRAELSSFMSRGDGFFPVRAQELPSVITGSLRPKWDSGMAIISGSGTSNGVCAIIGYRIDERAGMMDQHPFAVAVSASVVGASGLFVNHMSTTSRSIQLPSAFSGSFQASGISNYYFSNPPFSVASGSLPNLPAPAKEALA